MNLLISSYDYECSVDDGETVENINVSFNLYDFLTVAGEDTEGLTKDNSDIAFSFISDDVQKFSTPGDGKLSTAANWLGGKVPLTGEDVFTDEIFDSLYATIVDFSQVGEIDINKVVAFLAGKYYIFNYNINI